MAPQSPAAPTKPAPARSRLLLVEDDRGLAEMLDEILVGAGYEVETAGDGQAGLHLGLCREYDVIVLDRGLPAIEGLDLLGRLRSRGVTAPVLVLSALGLARDRVDGLDAGAEDYLGKPFDVEELLARIRALLRRNSDLAADVALPGGRLVVASRQVRTDAGAVVDLSERECDLLGLLGRRPGRVFTRDELLAQVFVEAGDVGVVDTYVYYLRRKLGRDLVRTVRGLGYQLGHVASGTGRTADG